MLRALILVPSAVTHQVQAAIHANTTHLPFPWEQCSSILNYSVTDQANSMLPVYQYLLGPDAELDILVYSGDVDAMVPVGGGSGTEVVVGVFIVGNKPHMHESKGILSRE